MHQFNLSFHTEKAFKFSYNRAEFIKTNLSKFKASNLQSHKLCAHSNNNKRKNLNSSKTSLSFLVVLSALMACTSLSTDVYLPAMPTMERQLHGDAELTITGFLIGFATMQLVWGLSAIEPSVKFRFSSMWRSLQSDQ